MSTTLVSMHPLFDPDSNYSRMRGPSCAEAKMYGYIHLLWHMAKEEAKPIIPRREGAHEELREFGWSLTAVEARANGTSGNGQVPSRRVLDAWQCAAMLVRNEAEITANSLPRGLIEICLVQEPDGTKALASRAWFAQLAGMSRCACRAFLFEPSVIAHAQRALSGRAWEDIFLAEVIRDNYQVGQIFAAAPELEGVVVGDEILFAHVGVLERYEILPPRTEQLRVVVVLDFVSEATQCDGVLARSVAALTRDVSRYQAGEGYRLDEVVRDFEARLLLRVSRDELLNDDAARAAYLGLPQAEYRDRLRLAYERYPGN